MACQTRSGKVVGRLSSDRGTDEESISDTFLARAQTTTSQDFGFDPVPKSLAVAQKGRGACLRQHRLNNVVSDTAIAQARDAAAGNIEFTLVHLNDSHYDSLGKAAASQLHHILVVEP